MLGIVGSYTSRGGTLLCRHARLKPMSLFEKCGQLSRRTLPVQRRQTKSVIEENYSLVCFPQASIEVRQETIKFWYENHGMRMSPLREIHGLTSLFGRDSSGTIQGWFAGRGWERAWLYL